MPDRTHPNLRHAMQNLLVADARLGAKEGWDKLYRYWQPRFLGFAARRTGDNETARDAVQSAWVDIYRGLSRLKDDRAFAVWAFRIVHRRCVKTLAKQARHSDADIAQETTAHDPRATTDAHIDLGRAIGRLTPEHQAVLTLFYREGFRVAEIAVALELAEGTVKTRLMHARNQLKTFMQDDNVKETENESV
ncbi:RNA polymerase sigma factor [Alterisphingorhabdus coralli]|uniref:Sigma-70 family RNA polymerase sigma factor n=1 Tax=Alterisphingorhabdus coralli TaxID=3071408 RepID=A0AA97F8G6_9SPHN|nr:sigma-70 family RNA polymerase sigma factor [Parasphingorhabdus sp. SCSIO 66989]WOE75856.1 sigma-70 family RNA polymerase sigma factor [Parasphingorhabdus sp. SCSIO 66989]